MDESSNSAAFRGLLLDHALDQLRAVTGRWAELLADGPDGFAPADPSVLDGAVPLAWEDVADPTDPVPDRSACALIRVRRPDGSTLLLLARGVSFGDLLRDWTGLDTVD